MTALDKINDFLTADGEPNGTALSETITLRLSEML